MDEANLTVIEEKEETNLASSVKKQKVLEIWRMMKLTSDDDKRATVEDALISSPSKGNIVTFAYSNTNTHAHTLLSIPTTSASKWIIYSGASRHVTRSCHEFSTYTHLTILESIQTANGMAQPIVGKSTVKCTKSMTLPNVLHASSFPVNLLSISAIILQLNCTVSFDIPKVIFQHKGTGRKLGTGTWRSGLWYLDRERIDSALASMVDQVEAKGVGRSVEDEQLLHHRRIWHSSFNVLSMLYPSLYEKVDK